MCHRRKQGFAGKSFLSVIIAQVNEMNNNSQKSFFALPCPPPYLQGPFRKRLPAEALRKFAPCPTAARSDCEKNSRTVDVRKQLNISKWGVLQKNLEHCHAYNGFVLCLKIPVISISLPSLLILLTHFVLLPT